MESVEIILKRAEILNLFSALFCQPEEEVTKNDELYERLALLFEDIEDTCISEVTKMKEAAANYSEQDLLIEYARLFIGPFKTPAPLYSSMYFPEKTLMSNVTLWVMEFYKTAGLHFDNSIKDLPDHISVESEFLYYLIYQASTEKQNENIESAAKYAGLAQYFIENHYSLWVPRFCDAIISSTENEFYLALANCLKKFTNSFNGKQLVSVFKS